MTNKKLQRGFSLVELLTVLAVLTVLSLLAIPNLIASRRAANEASAISSLRSLTSAQVTYQQTTGNGRFATMLTDLGTAKLIDNTLAAGRKDGYEFSITFTTLGPPARYVVSANPGTVSGLAATGTRRFGITTDGIVRSDTTSLSTSFTQADISSASPIN
jgi:prepilin-type N-terminal cleavage/methylation domain-containing protein